MTSSPLPSIQRNMLGMSHTLCRNSKLMASLSSTQCSKWGNHSAHWEHYSLRDTNIYSLKLCSNMLVSHHVEFVIIIDAGWMRGFRSSSTPIHICYVNVQIWKAAMEAMIGENRQLVTNEPVEVWDCRKISDHIRGICIIKENRRMWTCKVTGRTCKH